MSNLLRKTLEGLADIRSPLFRGLPIRTFGRGEDIDNQGSTTLFAYGYSTTIEAVEPMVRPVCFEQGCTERRDTHDDADLGHAFVGLDPRVFRVAATGHRCFVIRSTVEAMYGSILKLPSAREFEQQETGCGWVFSVGGDFGQGPAPHPGGLRVAHPTDALGLQVYFMRHAGKPLLTLDSHSEWGSPYLILTDRDLQGVDFDPATYEVQP